MGDPRSEACPRAYGVKDKDMRTWKIKVSAKMCWDVLVGSHSLWGKFDIYGLGANGGLIDSGHGTTHVDSCQ